MALVAEHTGGKIQGKASKVSSSGTISSCLRSRACRQASSSSVSKGLCQVVVCAMIQALHLIAGFRFCSEHQHRSADACLPELLHHLIAVFFGIITSRITAS